MRKAIAYTLCISLLVFSGCGNTEVSTSEISTSSETSTTAHTTTTDIFEFNPITYVDYDSYDEFMAAMAEEHPGITPYTLPQNITSDWTQSMRMDTSYYQYNLYDPENDRDIMIQVVFTEHYETIQEHLEEIRPYSSVEYETAAGDDHYAVVYYPEDNDYALYGLTGDDHTFYTLVIWNGDGNLDTKEDLISLREALQL